MTDDTDTPSIDGFFQDLIPFLQTLSQQHEMGLVDLHESPSALLARATRIAETTRSDDSGAEGDLCVVDGDMIVKLIQRFSPQPDEWEMEVASDSGDRIYMVRYDRVSHVVDLAENGPSETPNYACTCQDYLIRRKPNGAICKHIRNVMAKQPRNRTLAAQEALPPQYSEPVPQSVYDHALGAGNT